jgi:uncharacterized protein (DUF1778 family)
MTSTKDERLQIRVDPAEKRLLERTAEALDRPATVNRRLASALERPRQFRWLD